MYKYFILILLGAFIVGCGGGESEKKIPKDWEMIEVYSDEVDVLNEGGYYGLFYDRDNPLKDSFLEESDDRIVALAVAEKPVVGKSDAYIWVADSNFKLTLTEDKTDKRDKYFRKYEDENFEVTLDMKFWERIDGMDEEDMYIYRGKMKITSKEHKNSKEYRVKGGI
ncbi:MAG: hypothetical protein JNL75_05680 [Chitinophagales bacterium]|nr:hypothetical protein [Chitinophagales bacterium]